MLTVNDIKKATYDFIVSYKKVYNNIDARDAFLLKWTGEDSTFEKNYCISVDLVAKAVANYYNVDSKKVEELLINSNTNNLPKVKYVRDRKGTYCSKTYNHYYYLGDVN